MAGLRAQRLPDVEGLHEEPDADTAHDGLDAGARGAKCGGVRCADECLYRDVYRLVSIVVYTLIYKCMYMSVQ